MRQVPVRELNQRTADVLALVESGEHVEITRNGVPVAILQPASPNPLRALIESGELRPARGTLPMVTERDVVAEDSSGSEAVVADRSSDGRW